MLDVQSNQLNTSFDISDDLFNIGGEQLKSRLFIGTGKYGQDALISEVAKASEAEVITVAMRRVDISSAPDKRHNILDFIPKTMRLLPNTSGAKNADEAVRIARLAKASGCGNWIKIEVISDSRYLLPDGYETAKATEILSKEGFVVLPYMNPDLYVARSLVDAGAAAVMPLGAPIGSNRGLQTKEMIRILIDEIKLPIIVDAGIGRPSQAAEAMEMGAAACLVNTAIAGAADPVTMGRAFGLAVKSGRLAYLSGLGQVLNKGASASSPIENISTVSGDSEAGLTSFLG
ncbi:thiazole synthase [Desulfovibrio litoralis]|uniref:Thiazole synthase n=1 Tax=Desulfovibrio litoralis DSM 11393 TaxID=1121455 RepID=A0A1M7RQN9_9BACT|nr:thiazole synthase [Desulfovibrio litoralis]SHN48677.1 thiazole-phosphate synthase [Desulfovibrio litoralis DSM 11393]